MTDYTLNIEGMTCASCVARVEKAIAKVEGVEKVSVNLATEKAKIEVASGIDSAPLLDAVDRAGYTASLYQEDAPVAAKKDTQGWRVLIAGLLTLPLVAPMLLSPFGIHAMLPPLLQMALTIPVQFVLGWHFYTGAWAALRAKSGNMDLLVALGTSAAFGLSVYLLLKAGNGVTPHLYFEASASVITLIMLGKWLEGRAKRQTTSAIRALQNLRPEQATLIKEGKHSVVSINELQINDEVLVKPGERFPVDGEVLEGESMVDESLITGETRPISKQAGSHVTAGSINSDGVLVVRTSAIGSETMLSKIIRLVEDAQAEKAPIQRIVDQVSAVFVPVVVGIALVTLIGWLIYSGNVEQSIVNAVSVLVIACPCALGLATPTAIMVGTGVAAKHGILIKDSEALEVAHKINQVVFDKTGTLTEGKPAIKQIDVLADTSKSKCLALAASLQSGSEHSLAKAVLQAAEADNLELMPATQVRTVPGKGMVGQIGKAQIIMGNLKLMKDHGIDTSTFNEQSQRLEEEGYTVTWLAQSIEDSKHLLAIFAFGDTLRKGSAPAIKMLNHSHVQTTLLTGDNKGSARSVAAELGIYNAIAEVLPADKSKQIKTLRDKGDVVAMVGDGINDAPALAAAHVGIAMASGTDVAMQAAGITLMRPDPMLVPQAIDISKRTYRKIKQNLFWALIYNLIGIPLAAFGLLNPVVAGAAMAFSSVSVVSNTLLLKRWKPVEA